MKARRRAALVTTALSVMALAAVACVPPPVEGPGGSAPPPGGTTATTAGPGPTGPTTPTSTATTLPAPTTTLPDVKKLYSPVPVNGWGVLKETPVAFGEYVDAVEIVGDTVYAGGRFANAVKGALTQPRANLMAVSAITGDLLPFRADTNGTVNAIVSDGSSLYVAGNFTMINGVARNRIAKLNLTTGAVDLRFTAASPNVVHDMTIIGGKLYLVGEFNNVNNTPRKRAAAVNTTNGGLDPTFNPDVDAKVLAITASADGSHLYIGGNFSTVGGVARPFMAEIDPSTGAVKGPSFNRARATVMALSADRNGAKVYGGTQYNIAVQWNVNTGNDEWAVRADGDTQAVVYSNGYVYQGFHDGFGGDTTQRVHAIDPATGEVVAGFRPASSSHPGVWTLEGNGKYLVAGGYFANMGGVPVKGLAIFPAG